MQKYRLEDRSVEIFKLFSNNCIISIASIYRYSDISTLDIVVVMQKIIKFVDIATAEVNKTKTNGNNLVY